MADVFVSYARESEHLVRHAAAALRAAGYDVWWDQELLPHRPYAEVIEAQLRAASAVLVLWSEPGARSHWVRAEADMARGAGKLVQAVVDGVSPPMPFNQIQTARLDHWNGDPEHPEWRKVLASITALVGARTAVVAPIRQRRRWIAVAAAGTALTLAIIAGWQAGVRVLQPEDVRLAVLPFEATGAPSREMADLVADRTSALLSEREVPVTAAVGNDPQRGAVLLLTGSVSGPAERMVVRVRVNNAQSGLLLWSGVYSGRADEGLQERAADRLSDAGVVGYRALTHKGKRLRPDLLQALLASNEMSHTGRQEETRTQAARLMREAPDYAPGISRFAMSTALTLASQPPEVAVLRRKEAEAAARRALQLDPHDGSGYLALQTLLPRSARLRREALLREGLRQDPDHASLNAFYANLLRTVGRTHESAPFSLRAQHLDPAAPAKLSVAATGLMDAKRYAEAQPYLRKLLRAWPQSDDTRTTTLGLIVQHLPPAEGARWLDALQVAGAINPESEARWRAFLRVLTCRCGAAELGPRLTRAAVEGEETSALVVAALARMGLVDAAFASLRQAEPEGLAASNSLFSPATEMLRSDRRFLPLLEKLGLMDYWRRSKSRPDVCAAVATSPPFCGAI